MGAYDTMTAGLSGAGLALLSIITVHGTSEYHLNAEQMQAQLQSAAEEALLEARQSWASVEMKGQTAILSGPPPSDAAAEMAREAVMTSSGPGGLLWGGVIRVETAFLPIEAEASIERAGRVEIASAPEVVAVEAPYVWRAIKSSKGKIVLVGAVPDEAAKEKLTSLATEMSDNELDNRMQVSSGAPDGDWSNTAAFGLDQLLLLDSGEARLTDYELRVSGIALDDRVRMQAMASVANLKTPWRGVAKIDGPSLWHAELVDGQLVLSGQCATPDAKAEIKQIAQTHFDGQIVDRMEVGSVQQSGWVEYVSLDEEQVSSKGDGANIQDWSE